MQRSHARNAHLGVAGRVRGFQKKLYPQVSGSPACLVRCQNKDGKANMLYAYYQLRVQTAHADHRGRLRGITGGAIVAAERAMVSSGHAKRTSSTCSPVRPSCGAHLGVRKYYGCLANCGGQAEQQANPADGGPRPMRAHKSL
jgi:hypothetical protein